MIICVCCYPPEVRTMIVSFDSIDGFLVPDKFPVARVDEQQKIVAALEGVALLEKAGFSFHKVSIKIRDERYELPIERWHQPDGKVVSGIIDFPD